MDNNNLDPLDASFYFDAGFDPNRQTLYLSQHQTWPLPLQPSHMSQQQQSFPHQHLQAQQQQQSSQNAQRPLQHQQQHNQQQHQQQPSQQQFQQQQQQQRRVNTVAATPAAQHGALPTTTGAMAPLQTANLPFAAGISMNAMSPMLADWMGLSDFSQPAFTQGISASMSAADFGPYGGQLQTSPIDFGVNTTQTMMTTLPMDQFNIMTTSSMDMAQLAAMSSQQQTALSPAQQPFTMSDFQQELTNLNYANAQNDYTATASASIATGSPTEQLLEVRSLSSSDNGWEMVGHRNSIDLTDSRVIFNPGQALHIRTNSDASHHSDNLRSAQSPQSFTSWEEIQYPMHSPQSEAENSLELVQSHHSHSAHGCGHHHSHSHSHSHSQSFTGMPMMAHLDMSPQGYISPSQSVSPPLTHAQPVDIKQTASGSSSPSSSALSSPPTVRRRKSPIAAIGAKPTKTIIKKAPAHSTKKDHMGEKRIGKRKGPLGAEQRQRASEIRKLRACLRCKFLKKTCDKGDPCAGCQPSHARLWQVPCTRIDIKDIAYFMKDWKADYERHVSLGFSVGNIKGFSQQERPIYITHGYGHYLPIMAREVFVRDENCFGIDWVETLEGVSMHQFELNTARLSAGMEGISRTQLNEYLDRHIDGGFERFVDEYFEGTFFVTEILKTAYRFYLREKLPVIRKALKLVVAYNLTLHVTMVEGLPEDGTGKVEDDKSKFAGKTIAPVMINFQVKCALADMWRDLQKDVLEELSSLYSSVYSGDKLKNWPTIFMLAAILLAVWELIQFDCQYRVPDQQAVSKFINDMEGTPVGVIVGLFSAISQKLPSFNEWDTNKHHHLLASNKNVCDAMTEVRAHVTKYETYLKSRSECKFDRNDFDCLSNKFLSKLVIRAN